MFTLFHDSLSRFVGDSIENADESIFQGEQHISTQTSTELQKSTASAHVEFRYFTPFP